MSWEDDFDSFYDTEQEYLYVEDMANRGIWTTRDGTEIRVEDMTSSHIRNAKALCERNNVCDLYTPWIERFTEELRKRGESNE